MGPIHLRQQPTGGKLSEMLGGAIAQGVAKNLPQPEMQMQGRMQQQALNSFQGSLTGEENPAQLSMKWAQAMAGVPGSEQLERTVLPQFQQRAMVNMLGGLTGGTPGTVQPQGQGAPQVGGGAPQSPQSLGEMMPGVPQRGQMPGTQGEQKTLPGMFSPPAQQTGSPMLQGQPGIDPNMLYLSQLTGKPVEELMSLQAGVPQAQIQTQLGQEAQAQQASRQAIAENLERLATSRNPELKGNDLNNFMRLGQKYQDLPPEEWLRETIRDYQQFTTSMEAVQRANLPSKISRIFTPKGYNQDMIKGVGKLVKPLVDLGYESEMRDMLSGLELSPTEVEMVVRPLDESVVNDIDSFAKMPYQEDAFLLDDFDRPVYSKWASDNPEMAQKTTEKLANFLKEAVKPGTSLLALRQQLRANKGVDWQHFNKALEASGVDLTAEQQAELAELTYAPRDSAWYTFQGIGNFLDVIQSKL